jgi:hypothetical protein
MARADTPTWLPLDRWAQIVGINPMHFNQLTSNVLPVGSVCGDVWYQNSWAHPDQAAREDVAEAIREAEHRIAAIIGYYLLPDWVEDERVKTVRPARPELFASGSINLRGQLKSITSRWGYIISGGQKQVDLIKADVDVSDAAGALLDLDGDTFKETVRFIVNVASADLDSACEVRVFYPEGGVVPASGLAEWEVRPISVSIVGDTATITFKRWQIVDPELQFRLDTDSIDGDIDASFLQAVDVYRVWNDPQSMAQLLWESDNEPTGCPYCNGAGCPSCAFNSQVGCFHVRDEQLGILAYTPAAWDATNERFLRADYAVCRDPDQLRLWYYAGYESTHPLINCPRVQMDPFLEKIVAYYSAALIDRNVCSCNNIERFVSHWREDLARTGREVAFQLSPSDLDNPFGTTRGGIEAWRKIKTGDWIVHR